MNTPISGENTPTCLHVVFVGRVQGVGFRYTTARIAARFDISGTVQNLRSGEVELFAQGRRREVLSFLDGVIQAMRDQIDESTQEFVTCSRDFSGFQIL